MLCLTLPTFFLSYYKFSERKSCTRDFEAFNKTLHIAGITGEFEAFSNNLHIRQVLLATLKDLEKITRRVTHKKLYLVTSTFDWSLSSI